MPELVPLSVREVVADPVVLLLPLADPDIALFNFTCPLESRQWVAAETPEEAPGLDAGGEVVWAPAANTPAVRKRAAVRSFDMTLLLRCIDCYLSWPRATGTGAMLIQGDREPVYAVRQPTLGVG